MEPKVIAARDMLHLLLLTAPAPVRDNPMDCGDAYLCAAIALETGLGSGNYKHDTPVVHGLWPETGSHGSSRCIAPSGSTDDPTKVFSCYDQKDHTTADNLDFERHEWDKHGRCAGVVDATDFFDQLCNLSAAPLKVILPSSSVPP